MIELIILIALMLIIPDNAHAYLDLGTAGYLVQIILATLAGALFSIKIFWNKIRFFLGKVFGKKGHKGQDPGHMIKDDIAQGK